MHEIKWLVNVHDHRSTLEFLRDVMAGVEKILLRQMVDESQDLRFDSDSEIKYRRWLENW